MLVVLSNTHSEEPLCYLFLFHLVILTDALTICDDSFLPVKKMLLFVKFLLLYHIF